MEGVIVEEDIIVGVEVGTTVLTMPVEVRETEIVRNTKVTFIH